MVSLFSATPLPETELWKLAVARAEVPEDIGMGRADFRSAQFNMTKMSTDDYSILFEEAVKRFQVYNQRMVESRFAASWPGGQ